VTSERPAASDALSLARRGDRDACGALFGQWQPSVLAYCLLATGRDRDAALDLTQEVFQRAFSSLQSLRDDARFEPWLFSIARHLCLSHRSTTQRRKFALLQVALDGAETDTPFEVDPDHERLAQVRALIDAVPDEKLRKLVQERYLEGASVESLAQRFAMPLGTVTVKLMRFRAAVRKQLLEAELKEAA
jgi:RNA polymerase sigma-70 factor (ECF subfamily)